MLIEEPKYSTRVSSEMAGVNTHRISQWIHRGQFKTLHQPSGSGDSRQFTYVEVIQLAMFQALIDNGINADVAASLTPTLSADIKKQLGYVGMFLAMSRGESVTEVPLKTGVMCVSNREPGKIREIPIDSPIGRVLDDVGDSFYVFYMEPILRRMIDIYFPALLDQVRQVIRRVNSEMEIGRSASSSYPERVISLSSDDQPPKSQ
jgi:hypothetical protein